MKRLPGAYAGSIVRQFLIYSTLLFVMVNPREHAGCSDNFPSVPSDSVLWRSYSTLDPVSTWMGDR